MAHSPLLFVLAGAFAAYVLYTRITLYFARRQFKKDNGMSTQLAAVVYSDNSQAASHAQRSFIRTQFWALM
jgi:hypothetical protein